MAIIIKTIQFKSNSVLKELNFRTSEPKKDA